MNRIIIRGCTAVAAAFTAFGLYCLSIGNNGDALTVFYGALICLVVPSRSIERKVRVLVAIVPENGPTCEAVGEVHDTFDGVPYLHGNLTKRLSAGTKLYAGSAPPTETVTLANFGSNGPAHWSSAADMQSVIDSPSIQMPQGLTKDEMRSFIVSHVEPAGGPIADCGPNPVTWTDADRTRLSASLDKMYGPSDAPAESPNHECIIREGDDLVCTACGTTTAVQAGVPVDGVRGGDSTSQADLDAAIAGLNKRIALEGYLGGLGAVKSAYITGWLDRNKSGAKNE